MADVADTGIYDHAAQSSASQSASLAAPTGSTNSGETKSRPPAPLKNRKILAKRALSRRIETRVLFPLAGLLRMRAFAEILAYFAIGVYAKYQDTGKPAMGPKGDADRSFRDDRRYQFVFARHCPP